MFTNLGWAILQRMGFNICVGTHELRTRMRGARPFWLLLGYALVASASVLITYLIMNETGSYSYSAGPDSAEIGRMSFTVLAYVQLVLMALLLPGLSAGAVTLEREKRTLEMLRATLLTSFDIITGKMIVTLGFVILLLISSLPVAAWSLMLGGIQPMDLFYVYTYLFSAGALLSAIGYFTSASVKRMVGAVMSAYGVIFLVLAALPVLWFIVTEATRYSSYSSGGAPHVSAPVAFTLTVVPLIILGALAGLSVRWLLSLKQSWRGSSTVTLFSLLVGFAACAVGAIYVLEPVAGFLITMAPETPMLLHPAMLLAALIFSDIAREALSALTTAHPGLDPQPYLWGIGSSAALLVALGLWALTIRIFDRQTS